MANYKHLYFGPYLRVTLHYADAEVQERSCTKKECANHKREFWGDTPKFCDLCGSPIDKVFKIKREPVCKPYFLVEDEPIKEALWCMTPDKLSDIYTFMLPNQRRDRYRDFDLDVEWKDYVIEEKYINRDQEVAWFEEQFKREIAYVREKCGAQNVEVMWGMFTYSH